MNAADFQGFGQVRDDSGLAGAIAAEKYDKGHWRG
jgi:hypothetical protein